MTPSGSTDLRLRKAGFGDIPVLERLIADSARALGKDDYTPDQIEAALGTAWGVDTQLIKDGTYFVVESRGQIIACGGWSFRKTLFGADRGSRRDPGALDPARDAARIRAFFVHPGWARRGLGRILLEKCEAEARAAGFRAMELGATAPGERLYSKQGYIRGEPFEYALNDRLTMTIIPMRRELA
jgi:GNAT superfamily N-acetyltransferase